MGNIDQLMAFLDSSLTSYHAVENIRKELLRANFVELSERKYGLWRRAGTILWSGTGRP